MAVFHGCVIAVELSTQTPFKKKADLRRKITDNGGTVSFIVNKKCSYLIVNDRGNNDISYKCCTALKLGIPIVDAGFIDQCIEAQKILNPDYFLAIGKTKAQEFDSGKIAVSHHQEKVNKSCQAKNLNEFPMWISNQTGCPSFSEKHYEVVKFSVLRKNKSTETSFYVLEIHVDRASDTASASVPNKFRISSHYGKLLGNKYEDVCGETEYRFAQNSDEALFIYNALYQQMTERPNSYMKTTKLLSWRIGSLKFQQLASECLYIHDDGDLSAVVKELVEHIWKEALGTAAQFLNSGVTSIKSETLDKAEATLLEIRRALDKGSDTEMLEKLSDEFYLHIQEKEQQVIKTKKLLASKYYLCQLLRDIHSVLESMDWQLENASEAQYRALRCLVHELTRESMEYRNVHHMVANSKCGSEQVTVKNIYKVHRGVEAGKFCNELNNTQYLFHATGVENLVGVLSRGLLLPKTVVDSFAGTRSDLGMLGSAIYFTDALSTSLKYSHPSVSKGTRMMLVCEVALGKSHNVYKADSSIHSPPEGCHSVHGVRNTSDVPSDFQDDEYGIYNTSQQKLCYLVEFTLPADEIKSLSLTSLPLAEQSCLPAVDNNVDPVDIGDQKADKVQRAGLFSSTNVSVPLKSVHVRARLLDLASQVVVLQSYTNNSNSPIEAKYVFPLAENAVVCGFEAFINGKHIVGQVKEKETAHKEYTKAIREGHGAYLMDQEQDSPDVFTVSVGNLPPRASVLIKITYIAEVLVEGELIVFTVPASVAPWMKHAALNEQTQHDVDTIKVDGKMNETTVHVAVEMPFDIRSISSPSHKIRIKKTATRAVVEMCKNQIVGENGLRLEVTLSQIHVPRMWVERHPDNPDHQACMLTFYPEFEARAVENYEVVFLLDLSNSMKGSAIREAKKILLMCLEQLPKKCTFNVVMFGTAFEELFPSPRCKNKNNMNIAHKFMMKAEAVMGNTEIFRPLQTYFFLHSSDRVRNLFVISDGHINNEDLVLNAAKLNSRHTRIFTLGVSVIANRHTLSNLARMGAGTFEFFDSKTTNKWQEQVECLLWKASQPSLTSVSVEWQQFSDDLAGPQQAPSQITSLFSGSRQVVFGFVPNCLQATLKAVVDGQEIATLVSTPELNVTTGLILHRLTAKALIHDWEDGTLAEDHIQHQFLKKTQKSHMVNLSIQYSIVTQFTSFVAIEKREKDEVLNVLSDSHIQEIIKKESVDILNYMGWESSPTDEQAHLQSHRQKNLPPEELIETLLRSAKLQIAGSPTMAEQIYNEAWQIATKNFSPTNPTRLKVAMSMACFLYTTKHDRQKAYEIAKCAFEDSLSELDTLSEDSYKDSTLFLQLLRDNLTLWSEETKPLSDGLTGDADHHDLLDVLDVSCVYDLMDNDEASLEICEAISHPIGFSSDVEEDELLAELEELLKEDVEQNKETAEILLKAMPVTEYRQSKMPPVEKFAGSSDETIKLKLSSDVSIPTLGSALHVLDGTSQDSRMPKSYTDETVEDQHIKIPRSVVSGKMKKKKFPFSGNFNQENDDKQTKQVTFGSPAIVSRSKKEKLQTPILFGQRLICDSITKESALIDNLGMDTSGDFSMATPAAQSQMAIPMAPPQIKMSNQMAPPSSFLTRPSAAKSMPFSFGGFGGGGMPQQSQSYLGMEEARMNMMDDSLSEIESHLVAGAALHAHVGGSRGRGGRAYLSRKSTRYVESTEPCQTAVKSAQPDDIKLYGKGAVRYVRSILRTSVKRSNTETEAIARLQEEEGYWQFSETLVNLLGIDKAAFMNVLSDAGIHSLGKTATEDIYRLVLTMITVIQILRCRGISQHHLQSEFQKYVEETKQKNPFKDSRLMNGEINMENAILRGVAYTVSMDKMRPLVYSQLELGKNWFHVACQMLDVNL